MIAGILFAALSFGIILMYFLNRTIVKPVHQLRQNMDSISRGNFLKNPDIEWENELGEIGKGINDLSESVVNLMDTRIEQERQKKDLEYQILQSQINPHFLYNTLNSVKWMATIQGATGIADMMTVLARLLKNVSKRSESMITLKEELELAVITFRYRSTGTEAVSLSGTKLLQKIYIAVWYTDFRFSHSSKTLSSTALNRSGLLVQLLSLPPRRSPVKQRFSFSLSPMMASV